MNDLTSDGNGMISGRVDVLASSDFGFRQTSGAEIAGEFGITITALPNVNLSDVEAAVKEAFQRFEKEGFSEALLNYTLL